jgi:hypothetical protein
MSNANNANNAETAALVAELLEGCPANIKDLLRVFGATSTTTGIIIALGVFLRDVGDDRGAELVKDFAESYAEYEATVL